MGFSVLLSLYNREQPAYLRQSLDSIFLQSLPPNEVVLVLDGPLTAELDAVVKEYAVKHHEMVVVPLPENKGLGIALNEGLRHCSYDLVARMDTDDICKPERFNKQVAFMNEHPDIAVCGAWIDEFIESPEQVISTRKLPQDKETLQEFAKARSPMNHPVVMFRRSAVEAVGGYQHFPLFEDYWLWARLMVEGYKFYNIQESLLWFRSSPNTFRRRGGWNYACTEAKLLQSLHRIGLITSRQMIKNMIPRFIVRIMPNCIRGLIYKKILR